MMTADLLHLDLSHRDEPVQEHERCHHVGERALCLRASAELAVQSLDLIRRPQRLPLALR
jgi:hypothetical protein